MSEMSETTPLVSIVIPAYNGEKYVESAIDSCLNQSFEDIEVVVVDDQSSDQTLSLVSGYDDPRVVCVANPTRLGAVQNWNRCLSLARGEYVKLLCDDDLIYPSCLERQLAILRDPRHAKVQLVCCGRDVIDPQGKRVFRRIGFEGTEGVIAAHQAVKRIVRSGTNLIGEPAAVLFRADVARRTRGFDPHSLYMLDLSFWLQLLEQGDIYVQREVLCAFRISSGALSAKLAARQAKEARGFLRSLPKRWNCLSRSDVALGCLKACALNFFRKGLYLLLALSGRWSRS